MWNVEEARKSRELKAIIFGLDSFLHLVKGSLLTGILIIKVCLELLKLEVSCLTRFRHMFP